MVNESFDEPSVSNGEPYATMNRTRSASASEGRVQGQLLREDDVQRKEAHATVMSSPAPATGAEVPMNPAQIVAMRTPMGLGAVDAGSSGRSAKPSSPRPASESRRGRVDVVEGHHLAHEPDEHQTSQNAPPFQTGADFSPAIVWKRENEHHGDGKAQSDQAPRQERYQTSRSRPPMHSVPASSK